MDFLTAMRAAEGDATAAAALVFAQAPGDKRTADEAFDDIYPGDVVAVRLEGAAINSPELSRALDQAFDLALREQNIGMAGRQPTARTGKLNAVMRHLRQAICIAEGQHIVSGAGGDVCLVCEAQGVGVHAP